MSIKRGGSVLAKATKVGAAGNTSKPLNHGLDYNRNKSSRLFQLLWRMHYVIQIPMYFLKWPWALFVGLLAVLFWRVPTTDDEIAGLVEETSLIILLERDHAAEQIESERSSSESPTVEKRHYIIDVKECHLEQVVYHSREDAKSGGKPESKTPIRSWSMRYTKARIKGNSAAPWVTTIHAFIVNDQAIKESERRYSFLAFYLAASAHTKSHVFGEALAERILADASLREILWESTWTTTALHYGLLHGSMSPLTSERHDGNKWMGIGSTIDRAGLLAESENMSPLGARHSSGSRWEELDLPLSKFMLGARAALRRTMKEHDVPLVLLEGMFLSCIMHAVDHVRSHRVTWGMKYNPDFLSGQPGKWDDHFESASWRVMWVAPTLNPMYNNKIRYLSKPFYRQLYQRLKRIDSLGVVDEITASIMY